MITELMWLPWALPVPDGWRVVEDQRLSHHHHYSRLIVRHDAVSRPESGTQKVLPQPESSA
jgi:hypothetical protein